MRSRSMGIADGRARRPGAFFGRTFAAWMGDGYLGVTSMKRQLIATGSGLRRGATPPTQSHMSTLMEHRARVRAFRRGALELRRERICFAQFGVAEEERHVGSELRADEPSDTGWPHRYIQGRRRGCAPAKA